MFLAETCVLASAVRKTLVPLSQHWRICIALILLHMLMMIIVTTAGSELYQVNITISYPYGILA